MSMMWLDNIPRPPLSLLMSAKSEATPAQLYRDQEWGQVKTTLIKNYIEPEQQNVVSDQFFIQRQNELMEEIKQKIHRSRVKDNMEILPIDSSLSNISSAYNYAEDESLIRNKFTEEFESSLVNSALKEVRANCTEQTYETVRGYVMNNKQKQCDNLSKNLEKRGKEIQELQLNLILKQNEITRLKDQLAPYQTKADYLEEEKKKWRRKTDQIMQKQGRIHKAQMALIFKEKIFQEAKKRHQRLKAFSDQIHSKMHRMAQDLADTWQKIIDTMEKANGQCCDDPDPKGCWKKDVMKKCREKILEERSMLKDEQKQLEKEYEVMQSVSDQFKKLVSDNQEPVSANSNGGGSMLIPASTRKQESSTPNTNAFSLIQSEKAKGNK